MGSPLPNLGIHPEPGGIYPSSLWLTLSLLSLMALVAGCSISSKFHQELDVKGFISAARATPEGSIVTEDDLGDLYTVNLDSFGATDTALTLAARVEIDHGPLRFLVDRVGISSDGVGTFEGALGGADLPDGPYAMATSLHSSRLLMAFPLPKLDTGDSLPLDLRLLAGMNLTELRLELRSIADPATFSEIDEVAPTPVLGLDANLPISPSWRIDATFTFLPLSNVTGFDTECMDSQIRVGWTPLPDWEMFLGARNHSIELVGEQAGRPTEIDMQLELLEIGISHSF
ncbi:MAG: hypothetical protein VX404_01230 [Planctomycetota bacterium]|nr:hypothetical protein [Planctomycetota bacterium]